MAKTTQYLLVERTIRIVDRVPLDGEHYPDMTPIQAIDHELQLPRDEKVELFMTQLAERAANELELTERVYVER